MGNRGTYAAHLQTANSDESKPGRYSHLTNDQLFDGIAALTTALRGPMPDHERIFNASVRKGMRAEMERRLDANNVSPKGGGK